ncbi:MAG: hypothetical protein WBD46_15220 [Acidobacteriaceae bacterium]
MRLAEKEPKQKNPLDATMTKTQVVRRRFKSALPRTPQNRELSAMEAMARTMELFDRLRTMMGEAGLDKKNASAGLVFHQPRTKGKERVLAETIVLPGPDDIATFANRVMALDKPRFLGVFFQQHDPDPRADNAKYRDALFVWPFLNGPDDAARLIAARDQMARGGFKKTAN